jgi:hypothetical protein
MADILESHPCAGCAEVGNVLHQELIDRDEEPYCNILHETVGPNTECPKTKEMHEGMQNVKNAIEWIKTQEKDPATIAIYGDEPKRKEK